MSIFTIHLKCTFAGFFTTFTVIKNLKIKLFVNIFFEKTGQSMNLNTVNGNIVYIIICRFFLGFDCYWFIHKFIGGGLQNTSQGFFFSTWAREKFEHKECKDFVVVYDVLEKFQVFNHLLEEVWTSLKLWKKKIKNL